MSSFEENELALCPLPLFTESEYALGGASNGSTGEDIRHLYERIRDRTFLPRVRHRYFQIGRSIWEKAPEMGAHAVGLYLTLCAHSRSEPAFTIDPTDLTKQVRIAPPRVVRELETIKMAGLIDMEELVDRWVIRLDVSALEWETTGVAPLGQQATEASSVPLPTRTGRRGVGGKRPLEIRRRNGEWFWLNNFLIQMIPQIRLTGLAVYARLASMADTEHQTCWPKQAEVGACLGLSREAVNGIIARLKKAGLLASIHRFSIRGGAAIEQEHRRRIVDGVAQQISNRYVLLDIPELRYGPSEYGSRKARALRDALNYWIQIYQAHYATNVLPTILPPERRSLRSLLDQITGDYGTSPEVASTIIRGLMEIAWDTGLEPVNLEDFIRQHNRLKAMSQYRHLERKRLDEGRWLSPSEPRELTRGKRQKVATPPRVP